MSGRKTRTISEDRYEYLNRIAAGHSSLVADLPRLFEGVQQQCRSMLDQEMRTVNQRQQDFARSLAGLSERAAAFERDTTARLAAQQAQMNADKAYLEAAITQEREIRARQVAALQSEVDAIKDTAQREQEAAQAWLADADALHGAIRTHLPHERFAPGEVSAVDAELQTARTNLASGFAGPALGLAQGGFHRLTEIRGRVELLEHQWRQVQADARERLLTVRALAERNRTRPGITDDDRELPDVTIDVNALTDGAVTAAEKRIEARLAEVENLGTSVERLRAVTAEADAIEAAITDAVRAANVAHLATQARADLARNIVGTLQRNGYGRPREMTYEGDDQRNALFVKLRHPDGSTIVVEVAPTPAPSPLAAPGIHMTIHSFDVDTTSSETRDERMREIVDELRAEGNDVHAGQFTAEEPDRRVLDFDRLRKPGTDRDRDAG
ncbi:coiled-coil domain-containing protein [Dactylosporangium darangshiense]|uniref:Uncharacterized protein n=1 Tax=Dactylosporangium darangshiense TaxID=579108 RepID=A0ABP8DKW6_9ACTN